MKFRYHNSSVVTNASSLEFASNTKKMPWIVCWLYLKFRYVKGTVEHFSLKSQRVQ